MACWDPECGCYSVAAGGSSEPEHTLGLCSFCGDKLSPGTRNSAQFPQCAEEHKQGHAHPRCQAAVLALRDKGFTRFSVILYRRLPHLISNVSLTDEELESTSLLLEMCEVSLETFGNWGHFPAQGPMPALENAGTSQHSVPLTGLNRPSLIHKHTQELLKVLRGIHNLN